MAGHSKWANIKRKKQAQDKVKGNVFAKLSRMITLAVRESGGVGESEKNVNLRLAMELAKRNNMPKDTIDRAIEKGKAENKDGLQAVHYEAFGPGGAALYIVGTTDNPNRTVANIRSILEMSGGKLGQKGSVQYLFIELAQISLDQQYKSRILEIAEILDAVDIEEDKNITIFFPVAQMNLIHKKNGFGDFYEGPSIVYKPVTTIEITEEYIYTQLLELVGKLEELDDVQHVYMNVI